MCTAHKLWKVYFIIILDEENNGGELVQKTIQTTLKLALTFALKLQKRWKDWKKQ